MRVVTVLIVLAIIGLLVTQRFNRPPPAPDLPPSEAPAVPTHPDEVEPFGEALHRLYQDTDAQRRAQLEQSER